MPPSLSLGPVSEQHRSHADDPLSPPVSRQEFDHPLEAATTTTAPPESVAGPKMPSPRIKQERPVASPGSSSSKAKRKHKPRHPPPSHCPVCRVPVNLELDRAYNARRNCCTACAKKQTRAEAKMKKEGTTLRRAIKREAPGDSVDEAFGIESLKRIKMDTAEFDEQSVAGNSSVLDGHCGGDELPRPMAGAGVQAAAGAGDSGVMARTVPTSSAASLAAVAAFAQLPANWELLAVGSAADDQVGNPVFLMRPSPGPTSQANAGLHYGPNFSPTPMPNPAPSAQHQSMANQQAFRLSAASGQNCSDSPSTSSTGSDNTDSDNFGTFFPGSRQNNVEMTPPSSAAPMIHGNRKLLSQLGGEKHPRICPRCNKEVRTDIKKPYNMARNCCTACAKRQLRMQNKSKRVDGSRCRTEPIVQGPQLATPEDQLMMAQQQLAQQAFGPCPFSQKDQAAEHEVACALASLSSV